VRTGPEALTLEQVTTKGDKPFGSVSLKGPTLVVQYQNTAYLPGWTVNLPWKIAGYITNLQSPFVPFDHLVTNQGQYIPVQLLKRTTSLHEPLGASSWIELAGTHGYNLKVSSARGIGDLVISAGENPKENTNVLSPDDDMLSLNFQPPTAASSQTLKIQVLPESSAIPAYFPRFVGSCPSTDTQPLSRNRHR
jgi:hypothetical protein